jgi:uncharacterized protein (TIGR02118 family)
MKAPRVTTIVAIDCGPEDEKKYNKWYEEVHIPMLMKFKGLLGVTRYRMLGEGTNPKYLTMLEFESKEDYEAYEKSPELAAARAESRETWKDKPLPLRWRVPYELLRTWKR